MSILAFRSTATAGALAAATLALVAGSWRGAAIGSHSQDATAAETQQAPLWRTDLAAAMVEARRTKQPLLAIFR